MSHNILMISLVIGLGNIGKRYENTRHNLGFEVLQLVKKELKTELSSESTTSYRVEKKLGERNIILAWPTTYMNRSGWAAFDLLEEFSLQPSQMLAVVDDFNLPLGRVHGEPAQALLRHTKMSAGDLVREALGIAAELCIYTNASITVEEVS